MPKNSSSAPTAGAASLLIPESESDSYRKAFMEAAPASATETPARATSELSAAWESYHHALEEMRQRLEATSMFLNPRYRAKAYHCMMEVQAFAYNMAVAPRLATPRIHTASGWHDDLYSMALVGPDWHYGLMYLDGAHTYRLSGRLGDNKLLLIQTVSHLLGVEGGHTIDNFDLADMDVAEDGSYEIILGGPEREGNWMRLDESSSCNFIMIRRQLVDYGHEDIGTCDIEIISEVGPEYYEREEFDEAAITQRIRWAEATLRIYIQEFTIGLYDFAMAACEGRTNTMALAPGLTFTGGSPLCWYAQGVFALEDDEALILELDRAPVGPYWGLLLGDVWSRSLPFSRYQSSINNAQALQDADGGYRVVVSPRDPGVANWLDTTGHNDGTIYFRNFLTKDSIVPVAKKIKLYELEANLPADTVRVTPEQRAAHLAHRRTGFVALYGE